MTFRLPKTSAGTLPQVEAVAHTALPLAEDSWPTRPLGLTVNARVHPGGRPGTWSIEYGATTAYGSTTSARAIPGKRNAYMRETWTSGTNGWFAGLDTAQLSHQIGGFVRATIGGGNDPNHVDGAGTVILGPFGYVGHFNGAAGRMFLGGLRCDLRGATIDMRVRGNAFVANGALVAPWIQFDENPLWIEQTASAGTQRPNWHYTSEAFNASLASGEWESVSIEMRSNANLWTFAGRNATDGRPEYIYGELDSGLAATNVDLFLGMLGPVTVGTEPTGSIDYDDLVIAYRNHNVCAEQNGGSLVSAPSGGTDPGALTDGWRHGDGHTWQSGTSPTYPLDFVYSFADPITLECVVVANDPDYPARLVEVYVSTDGSTWTSLGQKELPQTHASGDNYLLQAWTEVAGGGLTFATLNSGTPVSYLRVRIQSAWSAGAVGLGSIEAFGSGATELTDRAWYDLSRDLELVAGTYHYRVVVETDLGTAYGPDQTVTVP